MILSANEVRIIGRAGKDAELKNTSGGNALAVFSLATDRQWKDQNGEYQKETSWHHCKVWGKLAEQAVTHIKKGKTVFVRGTLDYRKHWEHNTVTICEVRVLDFGVFDVALQPKEQPAGPGEHTGQVTGRSVDDMLGDIDDDVFTSDAEGFV